MGSQKKMIHMHFIFFSLVDMLVIKANIKEKHISHVHKALEPYFFTINAVILPIVFFVINFEHAFSWAITKMHFSRRDFDGIIGDQYQDKIYINSKI